MKTSTCVAAAAVMAAAVQLTAPDAARAQAGPDVATPPVAPMAPAPAPVGRLIHSGTVIEVELDETVSSRFAKPGEFVRLHLVHAIKDGDQTLAPAGAHGVAQVVHAAHAGAAGRPGELILAARYFEIDGQHLPIGHLHLGGQGHDHGDEAFAVAIAAGVAAFLVKGGDILVPPGTRASAQITGDLALNAPADAGAPTANPTTSQEGSAP